MQNKAKRDIYDKLRALRIDEFWDDAIKEKSGADGLIDKLFEIGFTAEELLMEIGLIPSFMLIKSNGDNKKILGISWEKLDHELQTELMCTALRQLLTHKDETDILHQVISESWYKKQYDK